MNHESASRERIEFRDTIFSGAERASCFVYSIYTFISIHRRDTRRTRKHCAFSTRNDDATISTRNYHRGARPRENDTQEENNNNHAPLSLARLRCARGCVSKHGWHKIAGGLVSRALPPCLLDWTIELFNAICVRSESLPAWVSAFFCFFLHSPRPACAITVSRCLMRPYSYYYYRRT